MVRRIVLGSVLILAMVMGNGPTWAADVERTQAQNQQQEQIYGSQLMSPQERAEYREKTRAAKTAEEREKIRQEHHAKMTARAKKHGVTLPDEPPERGMGGMAPGKSMAPGGGMGQGGGGKR